MINDKLINPDSIVVVGGSEDISKPGGKVLKNILDGGFRGRLYVVNPKADVVQGVKCIRDVALLPQVDLAVLAIPAKLCPGAVEELAVSKSTKAFIILSAGFGEESAEGRVLEKKIADVITRHNGCLIGPNCIGFLNCNYNGVFTTPIPELSPSGVDFISGSGATAVFIMESAIPSGLRFSSVWSVGNSAQVGVEDVLEYLDETYVPGISPAIKLLYVESIEKPGKLLRHASSLIRKGCRIAAIKAGSSEAGSRAASSHTGALASPDMAVDTLFRKAGIVRCSGRSELTAVACLFMLPLPEGRNIGIITHAGGPAVMLADALSRGGLEVPAVSGPSADALKEKLFPGSSVGNPIDFLATGTAEQMGHIIDACEHDFENIDAMAVIFGSPGLTPVHEVYDLLHSKMASSRKPIYPVLPSIINAGSEIREFIAKGNVFFSDETLFASALSKVMNTPAPAAAVTSDEFMVDNVQIRTIIEKSPDGYLEPYSVAGLLDAAGIKRVREDYARSRDEAGMKVSATGYPVVMKVIGPVHKSDVGGVILNIADGTAAIEAYMRLAAIPGATGVLIQEMVSGNELFAGVKEASPFGHLILTGPGGILVEVMKDTSAGLIPIGMEEALMMIRSLKSYQLIKGTRGKQGVDEREIAEVLCRISALIDAAPEIKEMDLNPLMASGRSVVVADARIRIEKGRSAT